MEANSLFSRQANNFWAYIKLISETVGYSTRGSKYLRSYSKEDLTQAFLKRSLSAEKIIFNEQLTSFGQAIIDYLNFRATVLEQVARPNLMNREQARTVFEQLRAELQPQCVLPMNKQSGEKRHYAYLTGIVNMLTEHALGSCNFDASPRGLVTITREGMPIRTLSRWMDGAYPGINNPVAVWEIKEYYGTTTFGSRVADGVYETMLDGLELQELREHEAIHVHHYLVIDDYYTWWDCGKSYLCRIVDMLHMGLVDEALFGREIVERWPTIVRKWQ
jgi:hypothetical protein